MSHASRISSDRPPYLGAAVVTGLVLLIYVVTLAPTVTFWDAGEFIAAAKTLGIPHPPGTPLFVMIAHVWALLFPLGEYAVRTNLLSALLSAAGAGFFFLIAHESIRLLTPDVPPNTGRLLRLGGAGAAALLGAFTFTNWQNSNETEVYAIATFTIALMGWLAHAWRAQRRTGRAPRLLLFIIYLAGVSIGNHLLALLAGPAVIMFVVSTLRASPAVDADERRAEWAQAAVLAGIWALLIGTGLGSSGLIALGGLCFLGAAAYAVMSGSGGFALLAFLIAAVGVTPYLYLYIRSAQNPQINEAAPATFDALLAVIRRAQYPPRTPLDDPTVSHGPENPGRTLGLLGIQLADYVVYFIWQWAKAAASGIQVAITLLFASLGIGGLFAQRRADRSSWWFLLMLFLVTGLGLVLYMNFKPGFGRWFDSYPSGAAHEVRERDYFFVVSFIVWGVWSGMGLVALARWMMRRFTPEYTPALLLVSLIPLALNWNAASRRHGPDARLAADFSYDLLNTVPPSGVLFTYGDNDTFPLWWAQEVAGIRQDVTVVCMALANTGHLPSSTGLFFSSKHQAAFCGARGGCAMSKQIESSTLPTPAMAQPIDIARQAWSYGLDAFQRGILFLDVMRQRGERHLERIAGVSERGVDHIETMDGPGILRSIDQIDKLDEVARRTYRLDDIPPEQHFTLNVLSVDGSRIWKGDEAP